jgi:hypothetical protein
VHTVRGAQLGKTAETARAPHGQGTRLEEILGFGFRGRAWKNFWICDASSVRTSFSSFSDGMTSTCSQGGHHTDALTCGRPLQRRQRAACCKCTTVERTGLSILPQATVIATDTPVAAPNLKELPPGSATLSRPGTPMAPISPQAKAMGHGGAGPGKAPLAKRSGLKKRLLIPMPRRAARGGPETSIYVSYVHPHASPCCPWRP